MIQLDQNLLLSVALFLLGVAASWWIARAYYRRAEVVGSLSWSYESARLIYARRGDFGDFKFTLDGREMADPSQARLVVWNSGNRTITSDDLSTLDPLRLELSGVEIADVKIAEQTRKAVAAAVSANKPNVLSLNFAFLDPGDGFAVDILSQRNGDDLKSNPSMSGAIRGLTNGIHRDYVSANSISLFGFMGLLAAAVVFGFDCVAIGIDLIHTWRLDVFALAKIVAGTLLLGFTVIFVVLCFVAGTDLPRRPAFLKGHARVGVRFAGLNPYLTFGRSYDRHFEYQELEERLSRADASIDRGK